MRKVIKMIMIFSVFFMSMSCRTDQIQPLSNFDYDEIRDLKLQGIVTNIRVPERRKFHGYGVINLRVLKSNMNFYDPRHEKDQYLLLIKNEKVELYEAADLLKKGDTVFVNIPNMTISYYSSEIKDTVNHIPQIYDKSFYEQIREENLQKL